MTDPQHRISDAERHEVAELLRAAAGEGRLDLDELDQRLEATYSARTYADLVPITLDLPARLERVEPTALTPRAAGPVSDAAPQRYLAIMGGLERKGVWEVPEQMTIVCLMGGADLDLREATFASREVTITVHAIMGGAQLTVGPDVHVSVEGIGIMGGYSAPAGSTAAAPPPDAPRVRVTGIALMGGINVDRKPRDG